MAKGPVNIIIIPATESDGGGGLEIVENSNISVSGGALNITTTSFTYPA